MTRDSAGLTVRPVRDAGGLRDWLRVPYTVFAQDPHWVPPLLLAERRRISPRHNPFFSFGEAEFFVAYRNGAPIGRLCAQVNRRYLAHHCDATGHFGFFDCLDDAPAAEALVAAAAHWLKERDLRRMLGPFNLTINEDTGLLVSGFDTAPAILSSHAAPWYGSLLEGCGLSKVVDLFAYRVKPAAMPATIQRLALLATQSGRVQIRPFDMTRYAEDVRLIFDIFNDAWADNWGFVPVGEEEVRALVRDTRPLMRGKFGRIVEVDGVPAAMMVALPDINTVIAPFRGRLLPFNWARLALAIWRDRWHSARIPLLGIRKQFRNTPISAGILSLLVSEFLRLSRDYDLEWLEFSWILETNRPMRALAEVAAGPPAKIYRIFERPL
jgi:hypothetical protein